MSNMSDTPAAPSELTTVGYRLSIDSPGRDPIVIITATGSRSQPEHGIIYADLVARDEADRHIAGWKEAAAMHHRNEEFYRDLIYQCGELLGPEVYIADDGSVQDEVLALKVPEMLKELVYPRNRFLRALRILITGK